jgi:Flp pilus assembly protein TadD
MQWRDSAHRIAARELLRAGKTAAAIEEIHQAEAIMPEDVQLALDCDADLRRQGAGAEADALYRRMADRLQADCRVFPRYASCRNDLAWLAANLDRDLDAALSNAQRAVELAPHSAGILDTLAEVHFRRGNRVKAIQLARRCIELDGNGPQYKERLARFGGESGTAPNPTASTPP